MRTLKLIFVLALAAAFVSCGSGKEKKSAEKKSTEAEVWTFLFDGTTTDGWRGYNKTTFPEQGWEIVDGTLHCVGSGRGEAGGEGGDIIFDKKFSNFDLKLEWKISETAAYSISDRKFPTGRYGEQPRRCRCLIMSATPMLRRAKTVIASQVLCMT